MIGAEKMSELAAKHLLRSGASNILVTNRTYERAVELACAVPPITEQEWLVFQNSELLSHRGHLFATKIGLRH